MRRWLFEVVVNVDGHLKTRQVEVTARDSYHAWKDVSKLPGVVSADPAKYDDGMYSQPVLVAV